MSMPIQGVDAQSIYASDPFVIASDVNVNNSVEFRPIERGSNSMDLDWTEMDETRFVSHPDQNPLSKSINLGTFQNLGLTGSFEVQDEGFNRNSDGLDFQKNKENQFNIAQTVNSGSTLSIGYQNQICGESLPFFDELPQPTQSGEFQLMGNQIQPAMLLQQDS
jgi:hypothetical protein